jgi:hypothetical protein
MARKYHLCRQVQAERRPNQTQQEMKTASAALELNLNTAAANIVKRATKNQRQVNNMFKDLWLAKRMTTKQMDIEDIM